VTSAVWRLASFSEAPLEDRPDDAGRGPARAGEDGAEPAGLGIFDAGPHAPRQAETRPHDADTAKTIPRFRMVTALPRLSRGDDDIPSGG